MLLRTHIVFGLFLFLVLYLLGGFSFLGGFEVVFFVFWLLIGTLIVDIDSSKSRVGRAWYFRPLQWFTKHRGLFHTLLFGLLISLVLYVFSDIASFGFFLGYFFHLLLDCFSPAGVKLFWPLYDKKIGLGKYGIRSGKLVEEVLFVVLLLVDIVFILKAIL